LDSEDALRAQAEKDKEKLKQEMKAQLDRAVAECKRQEQINWEARMNEMRSKYES
jgi:hypothetical protein